MKRSQAIKRIQEVLEEAYGEENSPYADCILTVLENDGMLPPEIKEQSFKILPSGEMVYNVNEWEPEE